MDENQKKLTRQELLEKMRNVRDVSEKEIFEEQNAKQSKEERSVENVSYLGKFTIGEQEVNVFMVEENNNGKNNYKIVDEEGKKIAIRTEQGIIFTREELSVDKMEELQKAFLQAVPENELNNMEKEELDKISKELGIEEKDINKMTEIELEEKKKEKEELDEEEQEKEIGKEELKDIKTLQEMKTNIKVNEREQLGQKFNFERVNQKPGSRFVKIAVVDSEKLSQSDGNKTENTRYSFVAVREDGSAQRVDDMLEMDMAYGNANAEETLKFDADETARMDQSTKSRYKIKGTNETLSVENGQYGELKVYYGGKAKGSNEIVETQLETKNVRPTSREVRETQSQYKGIDNKNNQLDEAKEHSSRGEESFSNKDADGDKDSYTHTHNEENEGDILILQDGTETTFSEEAKKINCSEETLRKVYEETEGRTVDERLEEAKDKTQDIEAAEMGAPTLNRYLQ